MQKWKITYHMREQDLFFYVDYWKQREGRILFTDKKTNMAKNLPFNMCSVEEVRQ
jgi:hypothetical protein